MGEPRFSVERLERFVNLYRRFRADGATVDAAWDGAYTVARAIEADAFREDVEADLAQLAVTR